MNLFTVILLYPDSIADPYGETILCHVRGESIAESITEAQHHASVVIGLESKWRYDFKPVAVFEGHLNDLKS